MPLTATTTTATAVPNATHSGTLNGIGDRTVTHALCRGAVVGGGRPVQGDGQVRGHIEPVVGYRQVRSELEIGQWPEFE